MLTADQRSEAAAAGVAELLRGWSADRVLATAQEIFLCVPADKLTEDDMAVNRPDPSLSRFTKKANLGRVEAFVSHSWHDSAKEKWEALQAWRADFKKAHNGREPNLWIDKYCIDQNNIAESLACLPCFLAGCRKLLVIAGESYTTRLWCVMEVSRPHRLCARLLSPIPVLCRSSPSYRWGSRPRRSR